MRVTRAALAGTEIELEIRIPLGHITRFIEGRGCDWRAAKIRVQQYPGRVDDAPEHRRGMFRRAIDEPRNDRLERRHPLTGTYAIELRCNKVA